MKTLVVVISARASYSRIRSVVTELSTGVCIQIRVVLIASAAMNKYGRVEEFLNSQGIEVDWKIESQLDAENMSSMAKTTGLAILGLSDYLLNLKPQGLLVIGDRHETLAASICGSYLGIKTFHIQGGERTGNIDDRVRFANTFLSDFHLVSNASAKKNLELCGINTNSIVITGCPSLDFIDSALEADLPPEIISGVGKGLMEVIDGEFLIVLQHSETTSNLAPKNQVLPTLRVINDLEIPTIWIWPNSDFGGEEIIREIRRMREAGSLNHVHFEKSLEPELFIKLLSKASCVVGNSSVGIRECSYLGIPSVNIGTRQNYRDTAENVLHVDFDYDQIMEGIKMRKNHRYERSTLYGDGKSAILIRKFLENSL